MYCFSLSTRAEQTSGTVSPIICMESSNRYCRLVYELPVAKKRKVMANFSCTDIAVKIVVSFLEICSLVKFIRYTNSVGDILMKFVYCPQWLKFYIIQQTESSTHPNSQTLFIHHCGVLVFFFISQRIKM